jgi:hypothetical protein
VGETVSRAGGGKATFLVVKSDTAKTGHIVTNAMSGVPGNKFSDGDKISTASGSATMAGDSYVESGALYKTLDTAYANTSSDIPLPKITAGGKQDGAANFARLWAIRDITGAVRDPSRVSKGCWEPNHLRL